MSREVEDEVVPGDLRAKRRPGRRRALAVIFLIALAAGFTLMLVFSELVHSLHS